MRPRPSIAKLTSQALLLIGVLQLISLIHAMPAAPPDLKSLVAGSDEVLIGHVTDVREVQVSTETINGARIPVKVMDAHVVVEQVFKGERATEVHVSFLVPQQPVGYHSIPPDSHRVLFLKKLTGGVMQPSSPYYPSLPVGNLPSPISEQLATVDKVLTAVAAVFGPPTSSLGDREEAMWVLHFVDSPIATQAFRGAASQDPDPTIRLNAVAELLRRNDLSVLPIAKQVLMNPSSAQISVPWRLEEVEQNLSSAVAQVRDERAIPTLSEILKSSDVRARRGAALALRSTGSPNAEDALLSCLGDSDFQVRYWGVVGLAEITGQNEWRPLREDFKSNEQKYLRHWVEWRKTGAP